MQKSSTSEASQKWHFGSVPIPGKSTKLSDATIYESFTSCFLTDYSKQTRYVGVIVFILRHPVLNHSAEKEGGGGGRGKNVQGLDWPSLCLVSLDTRNENST